MMISARPRTFIDTTMMSREGENDNGISEENTTKDKGKRRGKRSNALKQKEEKPEHYRLLGIMESKTKGAKQRQPSFLVPADMSSEVATPVSTRAMKLFEAIREHELHQVEEELASLTSTDKSQIDKLKLGGHGFALIHVAARYNFARIAKVLIQRGADPNIRTEDYKWTPLHLAARCVS